MMLMLHMHWVMLQQLRRIGAGWRIVVVVVVAQTEDYANG